MKPTRQEGGSQFSRLYKTYKWQQIRRRQLDKEPLCWRCKEKGFITEATVCNHTRGHPKGETERMFWEGPFDSQCAECHSGDQQRQELGSGPKGCGVDGWPLWRANEDDSRQP